MVLNVGDRVRYSYPGMTPHHWNGSQGIIRGITFSHIFDTDEGFYLIDWDEGNPIWTHIRSGESRSFTVDTVWGASVLRFVRPSVLQYDPTQQGDTDDDI